MSTKNTEIYERLFEQCEPFTWRRPWDFLRPPADFRVLPADMAGAVAALRAAFTDDELRAAGVLDTKSETGQGLDPLFVATAPTVYFVRGPTQNICGIVSDLSCLPKYALPLQQELRGAPWMPTAGAPPADVLGVFTVADLAILRALNVPAVPAHVLHKLSRAGLELLQGLLVPPTPAASASSLVTHPTRGDHAATPPPPATISPINLALVAGSLREANAVIPPALTSTACRLSHAERFLGSDFSPLTVWWPSPDELTELTFFAALQDCDLLRSFVTRPREELFRLDAFIAPAGPVRTPDPIDEYCKTSRILAGVEDTSGRMGRTPTDFATVAERYEGAVETLLVEPQMRAALHSSDPGERILGTQVAQVARQLAGITPGTRRSAWEYWQSRRDGQSPERADTARAQQMFALTENLLKLMRALASHRKGRSNRSGLFGT